MPQQDRAFKSEKRTLILLLKSYWQTQCHMCPKCEQQ